MVSDRFSSDTKAFWFLAYGYGMGTKIWNCVTSKKHWPHEAKGRFWARGLECI